MKQVFRDSRNPRPLAILPVIFFVLLVILLIHTEVPELLQLVDNTSNDLCVSVCKNSNSTPGFVAERATQVAMISPSGVDHSTLPVGERTRVAFLPDLLSLYSVLRT